MWRTYLPISRKIKEVEKKQNDWLSERWRRKKIRRDFQPDISSRNIIHLMDWEFSCSAGYTPMFNFKKYPDIGWASPWSQRHIAYAAGLGTFGINDLLITQKGTSHRCGSFVVNSKLQPNRKRQKDIHAYCLQYQGIDCLKCQEKCPVNAINQNGRIKEECGKREISTIKLEQELSYFYLRMRNVFCRHTMRIFDSQRLSEN